MKLGKKIFELRKKKGLSQEELGDKIGVTRQTISNWELGESGPNVDQLKSLSKELNISIDELVDNDVKELLVEKVSNTEKLAGLILKLIRIITIIFVIGIILVIIGLIVVKKHRHAIYNGNRIEETIHCKLYGEEHSYTILYDETTGIPLEEGGESYFYDILDLAKYNDAHQIFNIINDYVKKNNGTCKIIESKNIEDFINMYVKKSSSSGIVLVIKNNTEYNIEYGEEYYLEKYENNEWVKVPYKNDNFGFNAIAYSASTEEREFKLNWEFMYGKLSKGQYRIVKYFIFEKETPIESEDKYMLSTEFSID